MTGLVDTLERDGMVTRKPDQDDRRMLFVELTPRGQEFLGQIMPEHFRRISVLMAALTEPERRTLVRLLGKVADQAFLTFPASASLGAAVPAS